MTVAAKIFTAAINHLLARESWARECLMPYAGRTAHLSVPFAEMMMAVQADGLIAPGAPRMPNKPADVTITVPPAVFAEFMGGGQQAAMRRVKIDGDAQFAAALGKLAKQLRWEAEEDLAQCIGDAPAHRAAALMRSLRDRARRRGRNAAETVAEYLLDENPQLTRRILLDEFSAEMVQLRDALARLEKRIERAERALNAASPATAPPSLPGRPPDGAP